MDTGNTYWHHAKIKTTFSCTEKCPTCLKEVLTEGLTAIGRFYHKDCFKCIKCDGTLEEKFFTSEEQPMCENCFKVKMFLDKFLIDLWYLCVAKEKTFPKCTSYGKMVDGDSVVMKGDEEKIFHKECVTCTRCTDPIVGKYFVEEGNLICQKCLENEV